MPPKDQRKVDQFILYAVAAADLAALPYEQLQCRPPATPKGGRWALYAACSRRCSA